MLSTAFENASFMSYGKCQLCATDLFCAFVNKTKRNHTLHKNIIKMATSNPLNVQDLTDVSIELINNDENLHNSFHEMFRMSEFTDATLMAENRTVRVHKMLLSACSPFFRRIFRLWPGDGCLYIENIKFESLLQILHFIYVGYFVVNSSNLHEFMKTAQKLEIKFRTKGQNTILLNKCLGKKKYNFIRLFIYMILSDLIPFRCRL